MLKVKGYDFCVHTLNQGALKKTSTCEHGTLFFKALQSFLLLLIGLLSMTHQVPWDRILLTLYCRTLPSALLSFAFLRAALLTLALCGSSSLSLALSCML